MPDSEVLATLLRLRQVVSAMGEQIAAGPVSEPQTVAEVRARISGLFDLSRPSSPDELVERIVERLAADTVQVTHPRYFGLFNPAVPPITVVADALVAMFNPQLAAWEHSPAAQEMERLVLGALGGLVGLDLDGGMAHFTSCGATEHGASNRFWWSRPPAPPRRGSSIRWNRSSRWRVSSMFGCTPTPPGEEARCCRSACARRLSASNGPIR